MPKVRINRDAMSQRERDELDYESRFDVLDRPDQSTSFDDPEDDDSDDD